MKQTGSTNISKVYGGGGGEEAEVRHSYDEYFAHIKNKSTTNST